MRKVLLVILMPAWAVLILAGFLYGAGRACFKAGIGDYEAMPGAWRL